MAPCVFAPSVVALLALRRHALVHCRRSVLPSFEPDNITLDILLKEGHRLAGEQQAVNQLKLSDEYMRDTGGGGGSLVGLKG